MGFRIPWLESVSRKERQKREDKARRMMFPFGEEQKAAELRLLRSLIETREPGQRAAVPAVPGKSQSQPCR